MKEVESYLASRPSEQRAELERLIRLTRKLAPGATEGISYGMPVLKYSGKYLVGFAGFKDHMSIFPGAEAVSTMGTKLADYKTSKGTVQFTLEHPLPDDLVVEMITIRLNAIKSTN